jgi:hypothetical protein
VALTSAFAIEAMSLASRLLSRLGWSVLVRGTVHEVTPAEVADVDLQPWAPGRKTHWLRIAPTAITGRRVELTAGRIDRRGYM